MSHQIKKKFLVFLLNGLYNSNQSFFYKQIYFTYEFTDIYSRPFNFVGVTFVELSLNRENLADKCLFLSLKH